MEDSRKKVEAVEKFLQEFEDRHKGDQRVDDETICLLRKSILVRLDGGKPREQVMQWAGPVDQYPDSVYFAALATSRLLIWSGSLTHLVHGERGKGELRINFTEIPLENALLSEKWSPTYEKFFLKLRNRVSGEEWEAPPGDSWNPHIPKIRRIACGLRKRRDWIEVRLPWIGIVIALALGVASFFRP